jgi:hypothetical protein
MVIFWLWPRDNLLVGTNVSEEYTASIFRADAEGFMFLRKAGIHLQVNTSNNP